MTEFSMLGPLAVRVRGTEVDLRRDEDALEVLGELVDNSLVARTGTVTAPRFVTLDTIQAFASDRLRESDEHAAIEDRHACDR